MDKNTFFEKIRRSPRPVVVDFWAPWCGPCKMVKPILEKLAVEYKGRVDLWQINADDNPQLLQELKIYGIPTLLAFRNGEEAARYVGAKPASAFKALFETLASGKEIAQPGLSSADRIIRILIAAVLIGFGITNGTNWLLLVLGGVALFSAVYDRCPIWRAIKAQFKKLTTKS